MGQSAETPATGQYTLRTKTTDKCLYHKTGNTVEVLTCDKKNAKQNWIYDKAKQTVCNKGSMGSGNASPYCLDNGSDPKQPHKVLVYPTPQDDIPDTRKWTYSFTPGMADSQGGKLCNVKSGFCLENGGPSSAGLSVAAYNDDDKKPNKVWRANFAQCQQPSFEEPAGAILTGSNDDGICNVKCAKSNKGPSEYIGTWKPGKTANTNFCYCAKWDNCSK